MKRIIGTILSLFFVAANCLFCYGETKDNIMELYSRYREVRSRSQLPYLNSPSAEPVITEEMKQFYLDGEVDTLMFHAYKPKTFIVEDDFEFISFEEDGNQEAAVKSHFLTTNEIIIEELYGETKNEKRCEVIWIKEIDGTFYIVGDPTLSNYYIRASDLKMQ